MAKKKKTEKQKMAQDPPSNPPNPPAPPEDPHETTLPDQSQIDLKTRLTADEAHKSESVPADRRKEILLDMMRSIVTEPLLSEVKSNPEGSFEVIISLNELFSGGIVRALEWVKKRADEWQVQYTTISHYCFACLTGRQILQLAQEARALTEKFGRKGTVVYRIWKDTEISITLTKSLTTIKADAAQRAFAARGEGIVWAVFDSGVQGNHPHFKGNSPLFGPYDSFAVPDPLVHLDFTPDGAATDPNKNPNELPKESNPSAQIDRLGHGTHVSGIISGYWETAEAQKVVGIEMRDEMNDKKPIPMRDELRVISGVAPKCKILSLKVIADKTIAAGKDTAGQTAGSGKVSWILKAIEQIQKWNQNGKQILVHGVNMSLGYDFNPRWFACGQSPICVEVNRLVRSGVCVVVSAGNAGYGSFLMASTRAEEKYSSTSITDPGNADLAVTVGSTHREKPHTYGVSYFSSRGPTGDGRLKPDLLAPGERIISCAAGAEAAKYGGDPTLHDEKGQVLYCELSGTSMAAPHVSGAIAAFLSVRSEFIGEPERVKEIFLANTIDLRREPAFQGAGLLDLMKVLQAV